MLETIQTHLQSQLIAGLASRGLVPGHQGIQPDFNVFDNIAPGDQAGFLEYVSELVTLIMDAARVRLFQTGDQLQQGGFADS